MISKELAKEELREFKKLILVLDTILLIREKQGKNNTIIVDNVYSYAQERIAYLERIINE